MIERDHGLDVKLRAYGEALDAEIARAGALDRVRRNVLGERTLVVGLSWRRVAAAILIAGVLGAAFDLMLPEQVPESFDVAAVAPLYAFDASFDGADAQ